MFNLNLIQKKNNLEIEKFKVLDEIKFKRHIWKVNSFNFSENFKLIISNFLIFKFNKKRQLIKKFNPKSKSVFEGFFLKKKKYNFNSKKSSISLIKSKVQPKRVFIVNIKDILIKNLKIKKRLNLLFLKYFTSVFSTQRKIFFLFKYYHTNKKKRCMYTSFIKKYLLSKCVQKN